MARPSKLAEKRVVEDAAPLSAAKVDANRRNSAKSTGPRTLSGKRVCAVNATRHAILSVAPVVAGVESAADWEAHRHATIASLAPVGYVETLLAGRAAELFWRLGRVTRYETENTAERAARAAEEVHAAFLIPIFADEMEHREETLAAFRTLQQADDHSVIAPEVAESVLGTVAVRAKFERDDVWRDRLPSDVGEWTRKLVIEVAVEILNLAEGEGFERLGPNEALCAVSEQEGQRMREAGRERATLEADMRRSQRGRLLLPENGLEKVARYESHLERGLYKALHELQRMQATRAGADVVPRALDVAVSLADGENDARRVASFRRNNGAA